MPVAMIVRPGFSVATEYRAWLLECEVQCNWLAWLISDSANPGFARREHSSVNTMPWKGFFVFG